MIRRAAAAALLWIAATPPGWFPGAGWLVLPALALLYDVCLRARHPYWLAYAVGLLHLLAFSASLRFVAWPAYVAIAIVGAFYVVLLALWTRLLAPRIGGALAFGIGCAVVHWLRAHAPEIPYPHGQPIHALYRCPWLLGSVALGGEPLGNLLLGGLGAAATDVWRSWRCAELPWRRSLAILAGFAIALAFPVLAAPESHAAPARIALIEPGFAPRFRQAADAVRHYERALVRPTLATAGPNATSPPLLVVWPESGFLDPLVVSSGGARLEGPGGPRLARGTYLLANTVAFLPDQVRLANLLLDAGGRLAGFQWKRQLVPGGEYVPFLGLMPKSVSRALFDFFSGATGEPPALTAGELRPPLRVPRADGDSLHVGALVCFENAFPGFVAEQVAGGAELLAVLSNESWYEGGAELDQMIAMTVCRALETRTPIVRATVDGITGWVDADGRIREQLPPIPGGPDTEPRVLVVEVRPGAGHLPAMAWLHRWLPWILLGSILIAAPAIVRSWARLLAVRPDRNLARRGS